MKKLRTKMNRIFTAELVEVVLVVVIALMIAFIEVAFTSYLVMYSVGLFGVSLTYWNAFVLTTTIRIVFMRNLRAEKKKK